MSTEIEESVINKIRLRREKGRAEHGHTMEREDMTRLEWLLELQAELLDGSVYAEKMIREEIKRMKLEEMPPAFKPGQWGDDSVLIPPAS
jgi:hypothetical protein